MIYKILFFVGVSFNIFAHILLKKGMQNVSSGFDNGILPLLKVVISNPLLWLSGSLYAIGFIIYAIVLTKIDLF